MPFVFKCYLGLGKGLGLGIGLGLGVGLVLYVLYRGVCLNQGFALAGRTSAPD